MVGVDYSWLLLVVYRCHGVDDVYDDICYGISYALGALCKGQVVYYFHGIGQFDEAFGYCTCSCVIVVQHGDNLDFDVGRCSRDISLVAFWLVDLLVDWCIGWLVDCQWPVR